MKAIKGHMIRTHIRLTEEQSSALKMLAAQQQKSVAELIRQSVDAFIRLIGTVDDAERRRRAKAVAGRFHSGIPDLAEEHDRYFVESIES